MRVRLNMMFSISAPAIKAMMPVMLNANISLRCWRKIFRLNTCTKMKIKIQ